MPAAKHRHVGNYCSNSNSNSQTIKCEILEPWHVNLAAFSSHLRRMQRCWGVGILPNDDQTDDSPVFVSLPFYICPMSSAIIRQWWLCLLFSWRGSDSKRPKQGLLLWWEWVNWKGISYLCRPGVRQSLGRSNGWSSLGFNNEPTHNSDSGPFLEVAPLVSANQLSPQKYLARSCEKWRDILKNVLSFPSLLSEAKFPWFWSN